MKGQIFILSSVIIIIALTIIELNFLNAKLNNDDVTYMYNFEIQYIENLKKEIFISSILTEQNCSDNFIDFSDFIKNDLESKNYKFEMFGVLVYYKKDIPNKINITIINYMNEDLAVDLYLNSTPNQSNSTVIQKNRFYSILFDVNPHENYNLKINYNGSVNMTINFKEKVSVFVYVDLNIYSDDMKYIDKSQNSYYFS